MPCTTDPPLSIPTHPPTTTHTSTTPRSSSLYLPTPPTNTDTDAYVKQIIINRSCGSGRRWRETSGSPWASSARPSGERACTHADALRCCCRTPSYCCVPPPPAPIPQTPKNKTQKKSPPHLKTSYRKLRFVGPPSSAVSC